METPDKPHDIGCVRHVMDSAECTCSKSRPLRVGTYFHVPRGSGDGNWQVVAASYDGQENVRLPRLDEIICDLPNATDPNDETLARLIMDAINGNAAAAKSTGLESGSYAESA